MKKNVLSIFISMFFALASLAQGIKFEYGDWSSVKAKAKQENKIIFIDFYTSWCGPCKMLDKSVFPQKEVGDFYNKNFINYKIDAEKGEGPELAQKYGVKAFPTLVFTNANGDFLHQGVGGMDETTFIELGRAALDPNKQLGNLLKEGKGSITDMPAYLRKLSAEHLPFNDKYEAYISSLNKNEFLTNETYELMVELGGRKASGFTFDLIYNNREAFEKVVGEKKVDEYFYKKYLSKVYSAKNMKEPVEPIYGEISDNGFDFSEKIKATVTLTGYNYEGKYDDFLREAPLYLEKYAVNDPATKYSTVFAEANKFANQKTELKEYMLQVGEELIASDYKVSEVNSYIGRTYYDAGDLKTALGYYQKASDYNQEKGVEDPVISAIKHIKERIEIIEKGDYTFHISGLEQFNGLSFKLYYASATDIGSHVETEAVEIINGSCTITGNVKTPMPGGWGVYDGDNMKTKGNIIFEPGEFNVKLVGRDLEVENGWYNYYAYQGLRDMPNYKKTIQAIDGFYAKKKDLKDPEVREELFKYGQAKVDIEKEYYNNTYTYNADPIIRLLSFYVGNFWWEENAEEEIQKLKADLGDHYLLQTIEHHMMESKVREEMEASTAIGKQVKLFSAKDLKGKEFRLEKVLKKNEYVLLEFWASWCGPCRGAIPHLKELYSKYHKDGFEIVSFTLDHKESMWRKASEEEDFPWIDTSDLLAYKSPIVKMYGVAGVPYSLLIDKNGIIVYKQMGMSKELDKKLEELFE